MKLVQHKYPTIDRVEVELKQIEENVEFPVRPCEYNIIIFSHQNWLSCQENSNSKLLK